MSDMPTNIDRHFTVINAPQRSQEWFDARLGRVTGSNAKAVWDKTAKGLRTSKWQSYQDQLVAETLTGISADDVFVTNDMQRGVELEPIARHALARHIGVEIRETGFVSHNVMCIGSSLDGDIGNFEAIVELKCPRTTTHLRYIEEGKLPDDYAGQCMHNLYVTGAPTLFFGSFDDRLPPHLQLFVQEIQARDLPMEEYERDLKEFLQQLDQRVNALAWPKK
jgi:putative phage-type endonuclease